MICKKCEKKMTCIDTQENDNVRYRMYICSTCHESVGTIEQETDREECSHLLSKYRAEKVKAAKKRVVKTNDACPHKCRGCIAEHDDALCEVMLDNDTTADF